MNTKERAAPAGTSAAQGEPSTTKSIPSKPALGKQSPLAKLQDAKQLASGQMIEVVGELYPGYGAVAHMFAKHPDDYGLELRQDAMSALYAAFAPEMAPKRPRRAKRKLPCRIYGRLSKDDYEALQRLIKGLGYQTMQDWLAVTVRRALAMSRHRKEAQHG